MNGIGTIAIGSDHAGFALKARVIRFLEGLSLKVEDFGPFSDDPVDYPDFGIPVARAVSESRHSRGILVCGTGIGMSIVANKFPGVRAALCHDPADARASRLHNDSNILVMGGRITGEEAALELVRLWLQTGFEGGRHLRRLAKIDEIEKNTVKG